MRVRIYGLISWYEESALWLASTVASAAKACDHIVAVDGAYALFPDGRERSGAEQAAVIQEVCAANGLGCTIHTPWQPWQGNEVEKRSFMFAQAELLAEPEDWYLVLDADEVILEAPADLRPRLAATDLSAAEVTFRELDDFESQPKKAKVARQFDYPRENRYRIRTLFRALPGLTVSQNHFTYVADDQILWGNGAEQEPALDVSDLLVEHRTNFRDLNRRLRAKDYYQRRDRAEIEHSTCFVCRDKAGVKPVKAEPAIRDGVLSAASVLVCHECFPKAQAASDQLIAELGVDPRTLVYAGPE